MLQEVKKNTKEIKSGKTSMQMSIKSEKSASQITKLDKNLYNK